MKRLFSIILMMGLVLSLISACAADTSAPTELPTEPTALSTETVETQPPATEPPPTDPPAPTDPPEPTIPSLRVTADSYFNCYYSTAYQDYLNYYVHVPEDAVEDMPLIVYLHGDGEVNQPFSLLKRGIGGYVKNIYGEAFPFILLEPNTRIKSWISGDIPELLIELIDHVAEEYKINKDKIIITGHSRGAIGVWDLISTYGNYFSAAVPVSSPHQKGHIEYLKAAEVPVWTFAGDVGDIECWYHQYLAKNCEMINVSGGFGRFTVLKGCDHGEARRDAYVKETFDWMLEQQRGVIPTEEP